MKTLLAPVVVCLLGGCAAPPRIAMPTDATDIVTRDSFMPRVGEVATAEVGASMVRHASIVSRRSYTVTLLDSANGSMDLGHKISIPAGTRGPLVLKSGTKQKLFCANTGGVGTVATGSVVGCLVDPEGDGTFDYSMFAARDKSFPLDKAARYSLTTQDTDEVIAPTVRMEALYQGVSRGEVKVSFREFSEAGYARPAFTQDISYPLDPDGTTTIAFKGLRLKVQRATTSTVTYVVEKHPNR